MHRATLVVLLSLAAIVVVLVTSLPDASPALAEGYSVTNGKFQHYWDHRGGIRVLGYPISREFDLLDTKVQIFQRGVIQQRPDWSIGLLDILDDGFLPYIHIGGLTLPAADPAMVNAIPSPDDPSYEDRAIAILKANVPDEWEGVKTNFYTAYNTVTYREAFPLGDASEDRVILVNLEMWGFPVSKPTRDPRNSDFVYLRFQRGVLHHDQGSGETNWLPVGEYLKAMITGRELPADLASEAKGSRLYLQYDNSRPEGLANPSVLSGTYLFAAFEGDGIEVPAPVIPTATPAPTPTPAKPEWIEVEGVEWFVEQTNNALSMLPENTIEFIYRIVQVPDYSRFDYKNRVLYVTESDAFTPSWRDNRDAQTEWYGGWIAHMLVHAEQYWSGRPTRGLEAEQEARLRQKDFLLNHDSTEGVFPKQLTNIINKANLDFGDWAKP